MAREFAKSFYNSKEWATAREQALRDACYLCNRCGQPATMVHHKKRLSPQNIYDVSVSLNPKNLEALCNDCHNAEHSQEHGKGRERLEKYPYMFDSNGMLIRKPID